MSTRVRRGRTLRSRLLTYINSGVGRLRAAWQILVNAQTTLLNTLAGTRPARTSGSQSRLRDAIAQFNTALAAFNRAAMGFAESWAATDLAVIYREGAWTLLENADRRTSTFAWTTRHQAAITTLSAQYYADLTARIQEALRRARAFLRAAQAAVNNAPRGGFDIAALRRAHPLDTVVYANQARHPVDSWARSAITYQAATTANHGALNTGITDLDTLWFECVDGPECGFVSHQDTDHANGSIRSAEDAAAYPIAHHGCIREWIARPDLNGRRDLVSGDPL